jgi:hypothetical protein
MDILHNNFFCVCVCVYIYMLQIETPRPGFELCFLNKRSPLLTVFLLHVMCS